MEGKTSFEKRLYEYFYAAVQSAHLAGSTNKGWNPQKTYDDILAAHQTELDYLVRVRENVELVANSSIPATWTDSKTGKTLYNEFELERRVLKELRRVLDNIHQGTLEPALTARIAEIEGRREIKKKTS